MTNNDNSKTPVNLSIIMPCFNVSETLERAFDSIRMQQLSYSYEVVFVDDSSTDNSLEIARKYKLDAAWNELRIVAKEENQGNALAFYDGMHAASGKYICVLDGDDYYTVPDKFEKQLDFLESDEGSSYVGVCHYFVFDYGNDKVEIPQRYSFNDFSYIEFIRQKAGYFHTSTYLYRNVFRDNVPHEFKKMRGDTRRTALFMQYSGKKIRILNFVGSAYSYTFQGIWSSLSARKQCKLQMSVWQSLVDASDSDIERKTYHDQYNASKRRAVQLSASPHETREIIRPMISIEEGLVSAQSEIRAAFARNSSLVMRGLYGSEYHDSLCGTLGYIARINEPRLIQTQSTNSTCVLAQNERSLRLASEMVQPFMKELASRTSVFLLVSEPLTPGEFPPELNECATVIAPSQKCPNKFKFLCDAYAAIEPQQTYFLSEPDNVFGLALLQSEFCDNTEWLLFDQGIVLGIFSPKITHIAAHRPIDYAMLKAFRPEAATLLLPMVNETRQERDIPVEQKHDWKLRTACAASDYAQVDGRQACNYLEMVVKSLSKTGGTHIHYGTIPDQELARLSILLIEYGVSSESFIIRSYPECLEYAFVRDSIDVLIASFPVLNSFAIYSAFSAGVLVYGFDGLRRTSLLDYLDSSCFFWHEPDEFADLLANLTFDSLNELLNFQTFYVKRAFHSQDGRKNALLLNTTSKACTDMYIFDIMQNSLLGK